MLRTFTYVSTKSGDVLNDPVQGRDLVSKTVVAWEVAWHREESVRAKSIVDGDGHDVLSGSELPAIAGPLTACRLVSI